MSGIIGGRLGGSEIGDALDGLAGESESSWCHEYGDFGLRITSHDADERGSATWTDGVRAGVIDGAVTNLDELGWDVEDVFDRLLSRPAETAAALDGAFVIACMDPTTDRHLVVTDKLGARPAFHVRSGRLAYASGVDVLLPHIDEPSVNVQAVSDLLLMGNLWSDHTLVEEIVAQRPATVVDVTADERSSTRYWKPDYTEASPDKGYLVELTRRYQQAVERTSNTLPSRAGIWLSGGLDSRTTAAALHRYQDTAGFELESYTYDANPPTSDNPKIARQVARRLGIEHHEVPLTAGIVGENFERLVEATDGMHMWAYGSNLAATYGMDSPPPVLLEGMQGSLLGDHLYRYHLTEFSSPVDSQLSSESMTSTDQVESLLTEPVDPLESFRREASLSEESSVRDVVLDVHFGNYHSRVFMPSNRVMRDRVNTRVAQADREYLEWCAKLPCQYRKGSFRMRGVPDGGIPFEPTRIKLALIRELDPELADIRYERSKVKPSRPYPVHVAGFVGNVVVNRLRSRPTYGNGQLPDFWIRDTSTAVHDHVTRLVDDACDRDLFDADAVRSVYDDHMDGSNNASMLSAITTLEYWLGTHLD